MTCGMHEYYLVLHVHIHITSKNSDVCKLCPTERIFRLTWPQLWRHRSYVRGSGSWNFQGGRKKDGRKAIKNGDNRTVNKKDIQEKPQGGLVASTPPPPPPPVPARVKKDDIGWRYLITSGARSAERVFCGLREKSEYARPDPARHDPTRPDPTRPHHAFEKLISLERVGRFTSGLLCSMSPFNKFRIWPAPIPAGACHGTWHVPSERVSETPYPW